MSMKAASDCLLTGAGPACVLNWLRGPCGRHWHRLAGQTERPAGLPLAVATMQARRSVVVISSSCPASLLPAASLLAGGMSATEGSRVQRARDRLRAALRPAKRALRVATRPVRAVLRTRRWWLPEAVVLVFMLTASLVTPYLAAVGSCDGPIITLQGDAGLAWRLDLPVRREFFFFFLNRQLHSSLCLSPFKLLYGSFLLRKHCQRIYFYLHIKIFFKKKKT